jgi:hypothetical protein
MLAAAVALLVWFTHHATPTQQSASVAGAAASVANSEAAPPQAPLPSAQTPADAIEQPARDPDATAAAASRTSAATLAPTKGFRASATQRAADLAAYLAAADLAPLLPALELRAAAGDADAARRIHDIYNECAGVGMAIDHLGRDAGPAPVDVGRITPMDEPQRAAALAIGHERCARLIPGGDRSSRARLLAARLRSSAALANALGHPGIPDYDQPPPRNAAEHQIEAGVRAARLLQEGSAEAAMDMVNWADATPFAGESWMLAACSLGYPCGESPFLRNFFCAELGLECATRDWTSYVQRMSTPREWRRLQSERDQILAHWRRADLSSLLLPPARGGGG